MRDPRARGIGSAARNPAASVADFEPISGGGWDGSFVVEGRTPAGGDDEVAHINSVGFDFFKTFRTPVLLGREFNQRATAASQRVAVVNQAFARCYFQDRSPMGNGWRLRDRSGKRITRSWAW